MAIVQQTNGTYSGGATGVTLTLSAATAGNLLWYAVAADKTAGTWTGPAGYTAIMAHSSTSVSMWVGYKVAAGGETTAATSQTDTTQAGGTAWFGELSEAGTGAWTLVSATNPTDEAATSGTWASGTTSSLPVTGQALVFFGIDSGTATAQSYTNSFVAQLAIIATSGRAGLAVAYNSSITGAVSSVQTITGSTDQRSGAVGAFYRAAAAAFSPPPSYAARRRQAILVR